MNDGGGIVELGRVGHRQERPRARAQPERLVVGRPVHHVAVAGLLQQVGGDVALRGGGAHPTLRRPALAADDLLRHVVDQPPFVELPEIALALGVGAAVTDDLVAALADAVADLRVVLVEQRIDVVCRRQLELLEQVEQAPDADSVAVVAPGIIALLLRLALLGRIPAGALAIGVDLDIGGDAERQPLAAGPGIVLALADDRIVVAIVLGQRQHRMSSVWESFRRGLSPAPRTRASR